ncbi:hypothetical protein ACFGVS_23680 [Mucilaginibacter sp. AW1-7]|uniref:hypothetical protein n=1 Tax=Mucilaginibacter sp. AW1-7 TaxID=3349874 RepID=UPI003F737D19
MVKKCLRKSSWLLLILISPQTIYSQTKKYEDDVINHYFDAFRKTINEHISPFLTKKEKNILNAVKIQIDTAGSGNYTINSNSDNQTITISTNLLRMLTRFSVAQVIDLDTLSFNRKRFSGFYLSVYPFLSSGIYPEDAAEISEDKKSILFKFCGTADFQWMIEGKCLFLYLHELAHQFQGVSEQLKTINESSESDSSKAAKRLALETDADTYAVDKIMRMNLDPREYADALTFFTFVKERKFSTVEDVVFRQINYYNFCLWGLQCERTKQDELCMSLATHSKSLTRLFGFYSQLHSVASLKKIEQKAISSHDLGSIYNLGDFYLGGTSLHNEKLDSALYFYSLGASLKKPGTALSMQDSKRFDQEYEYCCLLSGKIYELKQNDIRQAISFYKKASDISLMFSKEFYDALILKLLKKL